MNQLQYLIYNSTEDILNISGMRFEIDSQVVVDRPLQILANNAEIRVVNHSVDKFPLHGAIVFQCPRASWDGGRLYGPGRGKYNLSGVITTDYTRLSNLSVIDFEYSLYTLHGNHPSMRDCYGFQKYDPPWNGYNYGILCDSSNGLIDHCSITADRHALVFGEDSQQNMATGCEFINHADVNCVAFKPNSDCNSVLTSTIFGTVNLGGDRQQIRNCHIYGRNSYPQPSIPFVCPSSSMYTFDHIIDGNFIHANPLRSGDFYGCLYLHLPEGEGTLQITNNRWFITGDNVQAPFIVGINGTIMADPGSSPDPDYILTHSNVMTRIPRP